MIIEALRTDFKRIVKKLIAELRKAALRRICSALPQQSLGTSGGLCSYFVNTLRSQGKSDAEIALRRAQKSGGPLIVGVYSEVLPQKLEWLPAKSAPAWSVWVPDGKPEQMELGF